MATTSIGAPGVVFPDGTTQASATTGEGTVTVYTSPSTFSKPTKLGLKYIKVTVIAAGGSGGNTTSSSNPGGNALVAAGGGGSGGIGIGMFPAPSLPTSPIAITAGSSGTPSSLGSIVSATAGGNAAPVTSNVSTNGSGGVRGSTTFGATTQVAMFGSAGATAGGNGGLGAVPAINTGDGGVGAVAVPTNGGINGGAASGYGAGGGGSVARSSGIPAIPRSATGGAGAPGYVIIEEFY